MNKFHKREMVLRQLLIGAGYYEALAMMEFAKKYHTGVRKDGVTPEFDHQVSIALYAWTLPNLIDREGTIATIFGHDLKEDFGLTDDELRAPFRCIVFANRVVKSIDCMSKKDHHGQVRDEVLLFNLMAEDERASIAKGADRMHNLQSMIGVFGPEKQRSYIDFGKKVILPMLKKARRNFPHQVMAYENIKFVLLSQIELLEAALEK